MRNKTRAQSILEYAVVLALVAAALTTMQHFFKRAIQASIKIAADQIGKQEDSEDVDLERGGVRVRGAVTSNIQTFTSPGGAKGIADLPATATERTRHYIGGAERKDFNTNTTTTGSSEYTSTEEE
jgi:phage gp16-like protein